MRRRIGWVGVLLVTALVLAGCGLGSLSVFDVSPGFQPTSLGFEVDEEGTIDVAAHTVTFMSEPGSIGGVIEGYRIQYLDEAGVPFVPGSAGISADNSLGIEVPPGVACVSTVPCTIMAPDAAYQRQVSEPRDNFITLPGPVAIAFLGSGTVAGRAEGVVYATTDNGREVEIEFSVPIQYPVAP